MFSKSKLQDKIFKSTKTDFLKIKYSFLNFGGKFKFSERSKNILEDDDAKKFLENRISENKLGITVGRLVKVLRKSGVSSKISFRGHKHIVDLEKCPNGFILKPNESAVIFTNEWFHFDSKTTAIILSRVSYYTKGLLLSSSYVDANWKGLLEIFITNFSDEPQTIKIGDEIGRLFFYELSGNGISSVESNVADSSHHYALAWDNIIKDGVDPFQKSVNNEIKNENINNFKKFISDNYKLGGGLIGVASLIALLFGFYTKIVEIGNLKKTINDNSTQIELLKKNEFVTGTIVFVLEEGQLKDKRSIDLDPVFKNGKVVFVENETYQNNNIKLFGNLSAYNQNAKLDIQVFRTDVEINIRKSYTVSYIVFK